MRLRGQVGRQVSISGGVRQGCVLSPVLFNLFLNYLLKTILPELEARGVESSYRLGTSLFKLDEHQNLTKKKEWGFLDADDLVFLAASKQELHETLCIFDRLMARSGMEMSVSKTKIMQTTTKDKSEALDLDLGTRGSVNEVSEFKYLGSIISADGPISTEITARIAKASAVFAALRRRIFGVALPRSQDESILCISSFHPLVRI